ncbi:MAG: hypothetical protein ACYS19_10080 [Planctomycetota bacterium]
MLNYSTLIRRAEVVTALLLTLIIIILHLVLMQHVNGLWRDEINSLNIATMPSLSDIWALSEYDSYPLLWFLVLRVWAALGWAASAAGLRVLGLLVGSSIIASVWVNGRNLGYSFPLLSLALFGLNPDFIHWGDSIRAYGLGCCLILLVFGLMWKVVQSPTPLRVAAATVTAILSVQCTYYNPFLLLAIILAGIAVALRRGLWKRSLLLLGIGLAAAVSVVPYVVVAMSRVQEQYMLPKMQRGFTAQVFFDRISRVLGSPGKFMIWIWAGLVVLTIAAAVFAQFRRRDGAEADKRKDLSLFCGTALVIGVLGYLLLLIVLNYPTQPWYYIALIAFVGLCVDTTLSSFATKNHVKILRIALVILIAALTLPVAWRNVHIRQTNMDLIASKLEKSVGKDDMILVSRHYYGISFQHYYKGIGRSITIPPIADQRVHRYDLVRGQMASADPLGPVFSRIAETLQSGGKVWIVGRLRFLPEGRTPEPFPPAPHSRFGWSTVIYLMNWRAQVGHFIKSHCVKLERLPALTDEVVYRHENCSLSVAQGWQQ